MKKFYLSLILAASLPFGAAADVLLDEDFEDVTTSTESYTLKYPDGWDVQGAYKGTYPGCLQGYLSAVFMASVLHK